MLEHFLNGWVDYPDDYPDDDTSVLKEEGKKKEEGACAPLGRPVEIQMHYSRYDCPMPRHCHSFLPLV